MGTLELATEAFDAAEQDEDVWSELSSPSSLERWSMSKRTSRAGSTASVHHQCTATAKSGCASTRKSLQASWNSRARAAVAAVCSAPRRSLGNEPRAERLCCNGILADLERQSNGDLGVVDCFAEPLAKAKQAGRHPLVRDGKDFGIVLGLVDCLQEELRRFLLRLVRPDARKPDQGLSPLRPLAQLCDDVLELCLGTARVP